MSAATTAGAMSGWSPSAISAALDASGTAAIPSAREVASPRLASGLWISVAPRRSTAASIASAASPTTTNSGSTAGATTSMTYWRIGRPSSGASSLAPPNRVADPAARTTPAGRLIDCSGLGLAIRVEQAGGGFGTPCRRRLRPHPSARLDLDGLPLPGRVLDEGDQARRHEPTRPHRRAPARHLGDLDHAPGRRHLDAPPVAAGDDVERLDGAARVDDHLHPIALHAAARCLSGTPVPPYRSATTSARIASAVSAGLRPPRSSPTGPRRRSSSAGLTPAPSSRWRRSPWVFFEPTAPTYRQPRRSASTIAGSSNLTSWVSTATASLGPRPMSSATSSGHPTTS